ncbi:MAG: response regulator [Reyranella sp.]|nr:response regulator [Reyranella sp.]
MSLLVIASVLPLLVFSLIAEYIGYRTDVGRLTQRTSSLARSIGLTIEQMMQTRIVALQVLARSRALRDGEVEVFRTQAQALVDQQFPGANILLLREDGQQVMALALPPNAPLPARRELGSIQQVMATGRPAVSDLFIGRIRGGPVIAIDVPVKDDTGKTYLFLSMNPRLEVLAETIRREHIPESWIVSVFDNKGVSVARTLNPEFYVGRRAGDALLEKMQKEATGTYEGPSREGIPVFTAFSRIDTLGWTVVVAVPQSELRAPALASSADILTVGAIMLAFSLGLAVIMARQISTPIALLRRLALMPGMSLPSGISATGLPETDEVAEALKASEQSRKRSEQTLRQAQKMEAIGNLTGGMAHDFNNLLGVIVGNLDIARSSLPAGSEAHELVDESLEAAVRGGELTKRLLAFARRQALRPSHLKLNGVVDDTVRLLRRTLGEEIEISLECADDLWPVIADRSQVEAALVNLATNARDAMPSGGQLKITTANRTLDGSYAAEHPDVSPGDYALIEVSDAGTGMEPHVLARIFEPFFTTKARGSGTGLGLAMVFGFMRQSGGHINATSTPGAGTTFRLYLPRAATEKDEALQTMRAATPRATGQIVLAVEDNLALRRVTVRQLLDLGYRVIEAGTGVEALSILEHEKVDLVFSDVVMPGGIDGTALAQAIAARWPSIKVVLTSGFSEANNRLSATKSGTPVRILSKPYRSTDLAAILHDTLHGR